VPYSEGLPMRSALSNLVAFLGACVATVLSPVPPWAGAPPRTGPATEKRFPPLQVPPGFKATLFACDPLIEYPSAIAAGPRPGALFVAIDPMTGLGTDIVRRDEIRLVEDTDGDGYADRATVFARGFNSIQGLAYHKGTVYVMHAPFLTALRDTKGVGIADERRDLLTGLGLTPEQNPTRLHCANGVVVGHDGWLYLALGDNGVNIPRPEGDRLVLRGGGILRCRPDGRDLHVFATGLRNIYDVALDAELNVFVRDNENDGGTYMIRVCHSFYGADHGYPYLYEERPDEALPPLADLGLGSSAGGVCYLERQFPPEYRGNLFFCEWGRAVVRYQPRPSGSSFAPLKEATFAFGAAKDPYGFRPTDLVVQRDGTLMVSDWADGQRPRRSRGRIYHIAHGGAVPAAAKPKAGGLKQWLEQLDSDSYYERCAAQAALQRLGHGGRQALTEALTQQRLGAHGRRHAIWALASTAGPSAIDLLLGVARSDSDPSVRAQAVRVVADLTDPVLIQHKLDAGPGDAALAARLADLARGQENRVVREIIIALGRLRWTGAPQWLPQHFHKVGQTGNPPHSPDTALAHAAMQTLRRSRNWPALLKLLDEPSTAPLRAIALRAVAERFEATVVDGLIDRLATAREAARRQEYADLLSRVYKKPGPWVYWGYRPPPRPPNTLAWERTEAIGRALDHALTDPNRGVRLAVLRRMQREKVPAQLATLGEWLRNEQQPGPVAAILDALREQPSAGARPYLESVVRGKKQSTANRLTAVALFVERFDAASMPRLRALAQELEDGPVLAEVLRQSARLLKHSAVGLLTGRLQSADGAVRAAAIAALGELRAPEGREPVLALLQDKDLRVRRAAAGAAGAVGAKQAAAQLLQLVVDADSTVRRASFDSLRLLGERRALPLAVAALGDRALELTALQCLGELGGPEQAAAVSEFARRNPSASAPAAAVRVLTAWQKRTGVTARQRQDLDRAVAEVHGANGILVRWAVNGPVTAQAAPQILERFAAPGQVGDRAVWHTDFATGTEAHLRWTPKEVAQEGLWIAYTDVVVPGPTAVEFLASSGPGLWVWLNGKELYRRDQTRKFQIDSDRFGGTLTGGTNRLLVQVGPSRGNVDFHLRFRRKSSKAEHERLTLAALTRAGNPASGRRVFLDVEKSLCLKCHRLGSQGERIGPELTGVGSRFARIYIVESILEPSRTIAPSFGTLLVTRQNGTVLTGVKIAETETTLTLADSQGQKHALARADIESVHSSPASAMPEGLEKRLTEDEFVDLIAFLASQKELRPRQ
jgi:putative membrane-bound dehydrogenase-like protein